MSKLMAGVVFNRFNGNSASGIVWCGYRRLLTADGANDFYTQVLFTDESSVLRYAVNTRLTPSTYYTPSFPPLSLLTLYSEMARRYWTYREGEAIYGFMYMKPSVRLCMAQ